MLIYVLDTSGPTAGVALWQDGTIRYEAAVNHKMTHSEAALPMTEEAYLKTGLQVEDTDYFAVTAGPGSFTGVRIGVTTVKALAKAHDKPCIALSSLEAMSCSQGYTDAVICPLQNARRGQVYAAAFDGLNGNRLLEDQPVALDELIRIVLSMSGDRKVLLTGDGMLAYWDELVRLGEPRLILADAAHAYIRPASAAVLAAERTEQAVNADSLRPCYLRAPQAVRQRNLVEKAQHE